MSEWISQVLQNSMSSEKWLAKLVATTVSSREEVIRRRIEDTTTISQESSKTSEEQENKKRNRKGGGRQKFKNFDGDVPMCMKLMMDELEKL